MKIITLLLMSLSLFAQKQNVRLSSPKSLEVHDRESFYVGDRDGLQVRAYRPEINYKPICIQNKKGITVKAYEASIVQLYKHLSFNDSSEVVSFVFSNFPTETFIFFTDEQYRPIGQFARVVGCPDERKVVSSDDIFKQDSYEKFKTFMDRYEKETREKALKEMKEKGNMWLPVQGH